MLYGTRTPHIMHSDSAPAFSSHVFLALSAVVSLLLLMFSVCVHSFVSSAFSDQFQGDIFCEACCCFPASLFWTREYMEYKVRSKDKEVAFAGAWISLRGAGSLQLVPKC
jgi:hypothetical protein